MKLQFCGAAREVTGSAHLLTLADGYQLLLDCGLYQGANEELNTYNKQWLFYPHEVDAVILSHAHIDHCGRLPQLVKQGFKGRIYCTPATRDLAAIMLLDSALIHERDAQYENKRRPRNAPKIEPLYTRQDVNQCLERFVSIAYRQSFKVQPNIEVYFTDAGHILGSASVALRIHENGKTTRLGFTGDIGRPNRPILRDPQPMPDVDYLICESTYGNRDHLSAPAEKDKFLDIIRHTCVEKKGKLIIPAFSVGRTQELVFILDNLEKEGKLPRIKVYVDSPLAVNATQIFSMHPDCFDDEMHQYLLTDTNPFGFNRLTYVKDINTSKFLNHTDEPCIIISASGMATAGRIKHHLYNSVGNAKNTVLIVGYASPETPAGMLRAGSPYLHLFGENVVVNAEVAIMDSFSAHGDRQEMLAFIRPQQPHLRRLFLVHGQFEAQLAFGELLSEAGFHPVTIPNLGDEFELAD